MPSFAPRILAVMLGLCACASRQPRGEGPAATPADAPSILSSPSLALVRALPGPMTMKVFSTEDMPPQIEPFARRLRSLAEAYAAGSNGRLAWRSVPAGDPKELEAEASRCKLQRLQVQKVREDKLELWKFFLGLCLEYRGQVASLSPAVRTEDLEYRISSLIKRLGAGRSKLAFTVGHGEGDPRSGFQEIATALAEERELVTVDPSSAAIPADVDGLVVGGPRRPFDEAGLRAIDAFIQAGKPVVFLLDGMILTAGEEGGRRAEPNGTGLGKLLARYGFEVGQHLVLDERNTPGPVDLGGGRVMIESPGFVLAHVPPTEVLPRPREVVFPFPTSVELTGPLADGQPTDGKLWRLAVTSSGAWRRAEPLRLGGSGDRTVEAATGPSRAFALGYAYEGPTDSAFSGRSRAPVRLVVFGDADFASDEYVRLYREGLSLWGAGAGLLLAAMEWAFEDPALAELRRKAVGAP